MLPRVLYELLPYAYLVVGISGSVLVDSNVIFIASVLLMSAGILVILMRYRFRRNASARRVQIVAAEGMSVLPPATDLLSLMVIPSAAQ